MVVVPKTWRELQKENILKQTGEADWQEPGFDEYLLSPRSRKDTDYLVSNAAVESANFGTDWNEVANITGYGNWRHDTDVPLDQFAQNPNEYRATRQTQLGKLVNGAVKMAPYTAATFIDNTVGLVDSILNVGIDAANGGEFHPVDSFINTYTADKMQQFRDWSDKVLPNYRTEAEIADADQWWKHLNGNFWGDMILKNLGFTLGAALSGGMYAKGFQMLRGKTFSDVYKAGLAAATGSSDAEAAFQKILQGARMKDPSRIYSSTESAMKAIKRMSASSQLIGGVGGAIGESRMEGMMAATEFRDEFALKAQNEYELSRQELLNRLLSDDNFSYDEDVYDGYGNITGETTRRLTPDGERELKRELIELRKTYGAKLDVIDDESRKLANTTFFLNMPLLTASNIIQFGRMFSGGWDTQLHGRLKGSFGNLRASGSRVESILEGLGNAVTEGTEEITQKIFSEGAKRIAENNYAAFNSGTYDKDSIKHVSQWMMEMLQSAGDVLIDPKSWEEFAAGFLTGSIGKMGSPRGGAQNIINNWQGGIIGGYVQAEKERNEQQVLAEKLNKLATDKEFRDRWDGMVRHQYYDSLMDQDLAQNNRFQWHTDKDSQILSDVLMFAKAGRLQDLYNIVDSFGTDRLTLSDIPEMRDMMTDGGQEGDKALIDNMSDQELLDWFHQRSSEVKKTIDQYNRLYNAVNFLAFGTSDEKAIEELIHTQAQLENFENRYNQIFDKTVEPIIANLQKIATETKKDGLPTTRARKAKELIQNAQSIRTLFGGKASDIRAREADSKGLASFVAVAVDNDTQEEALETLEGLGAFEGSPELKENIKDLQKLIRSRQYYYARLFDPKNRGKFQENFYQDARTDESVAEERQKEANQEEVNKALEVLRGAKNSIEYAKARLSVMKNMDPGIRGQFEEEIRKDAALSAYDDDIVKVDDFLQGIADMIEQDVAQEQNPIVKKSKQRVLDIINGFNSDEAVAAVDDVNLANDMALRMIENQIGNDRPAKIYFRNFVNQKINNIQSSNGQGNVGDNTIVPPSTTDDNIPGPDNNTGSNSDSDTPETEMTDEQISEVFTNAVDYVINITDQNDTRLQDYANGKFGDMRFLTEQDPQALMQMAIERIKVLMGEENDNGDEEVPEDPGTLNPEERLSNDPSKREELKGYRKKAHEEFIAQDTGSMSAEGVPVYDSHELSMGHVVPNSSLQQRAAVTWMNNHKVQEVRDSGALADMEKVYRLQGEEMPVYFIANPIAAANNPFRGAKVSNLLFAIEIDEDGVASEVIKRYKKAGLFADEHLVEIDGKKYQVIGEMRYPSVSVINELAITEEEKNAYRNVIDFYKNALGLSFANSIEKQVASDTDNISAEDGKFYIAKRDDGERLHSTLDYITSGRNITREPGHDEYQQIPISTALSEYIGYGKPFYLATKTADGIVKPDGSPAFDARLALNAPFGSIWICTENASGQPVWSHVHVTRVGDNGGYDFAANRDKRYVKRIYDSFGVLFKPVAPNLAFPTSENAEERKQIFYEKLAAIRDLRNIFYIQEGGITFDYASDGTVLVDIGRTQNISSVEDALEVLRMQNTRFQVDKSALNTEEGVNGLLDAADAGILTSEMRSFIRRGASVGVNFLDKQGNPMGTQKQVARTPSVSYYERKEGTNVLASNMRVDSISYELDSDNTVRKMSSNPTGGAVITDPVIVAKVKMLYALRSNPEYFETAYGGKSIRFESDHPVELYWAEIDGINVRVLRYDSISEEQGYTFVSDAVWEDYYQKAAEQEKQREAETNKSAEQAGETATVEQPQSSIEPKPKRHELGRFAFDDDIMDKDNNNTAEKKDKDKSKEEKSVGC